MFKEVNRETFHATVGQLNVHPTPIGEWDNEKRGYFTEWRDVRTGQVLGTSFAGKYEVLSKFIRNSEVNHD